VAWLNLPDLLHEICTVVAAADFTSGERKKSSVGGQGSKGKEEKAKGVVRKEKAVQHPRHPR